MTTNASCQWSPVACLECKFFGVESLGAGFDLFDGVLLPG